MRYTTSPKGTDLLQERWWKGSAILCGTTVVGLGTAGIAKHTDSRGNGQRPMAESRDPDSSRWPALMAGRGEHEDCVETAWPFAALGGGGEVSSMSKLEWEERLITQVDHPCWTCCNFKSRIISSTE
jgi:hypothetical protein